MTSTRQDIDQYDKQQVENTTDNNDSQEIITIVGRTKVRKLKTKRPDSPFIIDDQEQETFQARILWIYTQDDLEEFGPLKHPPPPPVDANIPSLQNIGIAISLDNDDDDITLARLTILPIPNQTDEWEDVDSSDFHNDYRCILPSSSSHNDHNDSPPSPERIRSRTPQEILQGLDVVHEEEEEDCIVIAEEGPPAGSDLLEKRQSYPYIKNKGIQRPESNDNEDDDEDNIHHENTIDEEEEQPVVVILLLNNIDTDPIEPENQPEAQPSESHQTPSSTKKKTLKTTTKQMCSRHQLFSTATARNPKANPACAPTLLPNPLSPSRNNLPHIPRLPPLCSGSTSVAPPTTTPASEASEAAKNA